MLVESEFCVEFKFHPAKSGFSTPQNLAWSWMTVPLHVAYQAMQLLGRHTWKHRTRQWCNWAPERKGKRLKEWCSAVEEPFTQFSTKNVELKWPSDSDLASLTLVQRSPAYHRYSGSLIFRWFTSCTYATKFQKTADIWVRNFRAGLAQGKLAGQGEMCIERICGATFRVSFSWTEIIYHSALLTC